MSIKGNLEAVENNIENACKASGRDRSEVTLIAVSKTKPVEMLQEAYDAGIRDFGENKVQELTDKYDKMPSDIKWHMIGHLQRNKVKYIVDKVVMIHSVDSVALAEEISKQAVKKGVDNVDILVEVNIGDEDSKFGIVYNQAAEFVEKIMSFSNITVRGFMCVAPIALNPDENRQYFTQMKQLCVDINAKMGNNSSVNVLSMGMTGDYQVAIEEGATLVRVGTGIFGERDYSI